MLGPFAAAGQPFVPKDAGQVLERLQATALDAAGRDLRSLRARLSADPTNVTLACDFARRCIERSRAEADPRYLGRAQAGLAPWWDLPAPPAEPLVLRATIKQSQHDFLGALSDLELAAKMAPRNPQIWLTRTTILTLLGDYAAARKACLPLAQLAPGIIALTAATSVASLGAESERGCAFLKRALEANPGAGNDERVWALTVLGEAAERRGVVAEAEEDFKQALSLRPSDPYLLGAYADLLLDQGRAREVVDLLRAETRADGLLLRLVLAEASESRRPAGYQEHLETLRARFEAGHRRGDFVHQREEARFELQILKRPREALVLAQANWQVQHEPADVRLLVEAALAAHSPAAAQPALDFVRTNHLEYVTLGKRVQQFPSH